MVWQTVTLLKLTVTPKLPFTPKLDFLYAPHLFKESRIRVRYYRHVERRSTPPLRPLPAAPLGLLRGEAAIWLRGGGEHRSLAQLPSAPLQLPTEITRVNIQPGSAWLSNE